MKKIALLALLTVLGFTVSAQIKITVKMPVADTSKYVQLAHYYGYKQFFKVDSAKVQKNGLLEFKNTGEAWKGGIYLVVTSPSKFYDFILSGNEKDIYMELDTADYVGSVKFKGSAENDVLFGYRKYLNKVAKDGEIYQTQLKTETDPAKVNELRAKLGGMQKEVNAELKKRAALKPELLASKVLLANLEPELPEKPPLLANGRPDSTYFYRTYKKHYFDNTDFSDERMIRSPFLETKLEKYFGNLVYQKTDSLKKEADYVLGLAKKNTDVYRYALWYITNKYENSNIVGLDGTVIHLYKNHYLKNANWLDSAQRARFVERLTIMEPLETGKVLPALVLKDTLGVAHKLNDVKAKYLVVYFYSPTCGHCKDHAPELAKFQEDNRSNGVVVWNVASDPERNFDEMKKFINTYGMSKVTNLYDPDRRYNFNQSYDVYRTPTSYILDENKRIIGRQIPIEDIMGYIDHYEKNIKGK